MGQDSRTSVDTWLPCPDRLKGKRPMFCTRCHAIDPLTAWMPQAMYFSDWHLRKHSKDNKPPIQQRTIGENYDEATTE